MHYIKKLCILKQLSSGFAADGRKVSALLTAESIPGRLTLSLAAIGFAPLSAGRYRCLVCDAKGQTELFDMSESGGSVKKDSALDISEGLACLVCFAGGRVTPVAFGKCGDRVYDVKKLCALVDGTENPAKDAGGKTEETSAGKRGAKNLPAPAAQGAEGAEQAPPYDDEAVATQNYFAFSEDGHEEDGAGEQAGESGEGAGKDEDAQSLFRFTGGEGGGADAGACYYDKVKGELTALFGKYPAEEELAACIPYSRWARVVFSRNKYYTVGVICDEKKPKYICYGVPAETHGEPPAALKGFCSFLPLSVFDTEGRGYWMMFQDAETGQCVKIKKA